MTDPVPPVLTVDGPSGAGKGTVSARVAKRLGWHLLDSGVVYRALGVHAIEQQVSADDHQGLEDLCRNMKLAFLDRKSTRLNSSHVATSYAVFCLKKKKEPPGSK